MTLADAPFKIDELYVLWTSEGMSCDGDTVSMTAASQPRIEDVVLGLIPGLPKVRGTRARPGPSSRKSTRSVGKD